MMIEKTQADCIDCGLCTKHCAFLQKYELTLKDFTYRPDLRLSCFMCGTCTRVCPKDLAGEEIALELRQRAHQHYRPAPPRKLLLRHPTAQAGQEENRKNHIGFFKNHYPLSNYPSRAALQKQKNSPEPEHALLFLGCNYPGFYPKTSAALIRLCKSFGINTLIDCCKKPVYEQGGSPDFSRIKRALEAAGADTLICACPNCYHFLKGRLNARIINIYEFLYTHRIGSPLPGCPAIFFPCSDKPTREIFAFVRHYIRDYTEPYAHINCCGLGGGARKHEPGIIAQTRSQLHEVQQQYNTIYTYCSSCSGIFAAYGLQNITNFLPAILGIDEMVSPYYALNVLKFAIGWH